MSRLEQPRSLVVRVAAVVLALSLGACVTSTATSDAQFIDRIRNATTRADHASLAEQYEQEAKNASQKAAEHRRMRENYQTGPGGGRGLSSRSSLLRHCDNLINQYQRVTLEYEGLASLHRQLATEAQK